MDQKFFKRHIIRMPSTLYHNLFVKGGDRAIAVYALLRASRGREEFFRAYKASNNKMVKGYYLLATKVNISRKTLEKYVPILIELGLCKFDEQGNFYMTGTRKLNEMFIGKNGKVKLVPVQVGNSIIDTQLNSQIIRFHSLANAQLREIYKKKERKELLMHLERAEKDPSYSITTEEFKKARRLKKKYGKVADLKLTEEIVLSLLKVAEIIGNGTVSKERGAYYKKKLIKAYLLSFRRRFSVLTDVYIPKATFLSLKYNGDFPSNTFWVDGMAVLELVSAFRPLTNGVSPKSQKFNTDSNGDRLDSAEYL